MSSILRWVIGLLVISVIIGYVIIRPKLPILTGYAAKKVCSCSFISDRTLESIRNEDLQNPLFDYTTIEISERDKTVTASVLGMAKSTALYDKDFGCSLLYRKMNKKPAIHRTFDPRFDTIPYPYGDKELRFISSPKEIALTDSIIDYAFDKNGKWDKQTRALLVLHRDTLILEHYSEGFDNETEIDGWSMTKSLTNALIGILVKEGQLNINDDSLFQSWTDSRVTITINDLLQMESGLRWTEEYGSNTDVTDLLYKEPNVVDYAISPDLEFDPGTHWEYSSGTTNILGGIIRQKFSSHEEYLDFPYHSLLDKLNMKSAILETDAYGNYVLSSYCFATPRDWARLGTLYLHEGKWLGEEIFTKGWAQYSVTPNGTSKGEYGAQIWLNKDKKYFPSLPEDAYKFSGYEGQNVCIVPSEELVIVRMGTSKGPPFDLDGTLARIMDLVKA